MRWPISSRKGGVNADVSQISERPDPPAAMVRKITDEGHQKLCEDLRAWRIKTVLQVDATCKQAADEIERLAALAQSDAKRIAELEAECGRFENDLFEARSALETVEAENEHHIRLAFIDAGAIPARTWKEENERLRAALDAKPVQQIEEQSDARKRREVELLELDAAFEIKQLAAKIDRLADKIFNLAIAEEQDYRAADRREAENERQDHDRPIE